MLQHSHSQTSVELESQNLIKLYTRQAYLLQHSHSKDTVKLEPKFGQIIQQNKAYMLQHSHSQTSVELESQNLVKLYNKTSLFSTAQPLPHFSRAREPKFGQIIHKTKPNTTAQLLQGSSGAIAIIWSNYARQA